MEWHVEEQQEDVCCVCSGDSNQSWLENPYAPPLGYALQHQGSGVSQQGLLPNQGMMNGYHDNDYPGNGPQGLVNGHQGLVNNPQGLVNGLQGLVNSPAKNNLGFRHQRQTDNPLADERWPFTPMAAEPNHGGHAPYGNEAYQHLPFSTRATSAVGPLARMGSGGLIRFGSGDQRAHGTVGHSGLLPGQSFGAGLMRQASSPASGMPLHGAAAAMPWGPAGFRQQPALERTASNSAASGHSVIMHGPHSLLERPGPGEQQNRLLRQDHSNHSV